MQSLQGATKVMTSANEAMNVSEISTLMKNFQKEQMKQEMNGEMVAEVMDMGGEGVGEEADAIYDSILGELAMDVNTQVSSTGTGAVGVGPQANPGKTNEVGDLESRLAALGDP